MVICLDRLSAERGLGDGYGQGESGRMGTERSKVAGSRIKACARGSHVSDEGERLEALRG